MSDPVVAPAPAPAAASPASPSPAPTALSPSPVVTPPVAPARATIAPAPVAAPTPAPTAAAAASEDFFYSKLPETWRSDLSKGMNLTEGQTNILNRYSTLPKLVESYFHAQDKIRKGEAATGPTLPANASPEQIAEYRTKLGLPTEVDKYNVALDPNMVMSDEDERIMSEVFKVAHDNFVKPELVGKLANAMFKARELEMQAHGEKHGVEAQTCTRTLRETWGNDFQTNMNMTHAIINRLPADVKEAFSGAILSDGRLVFNSPEVIAWLADISREINPAATVLPNSSNPVAGIKEELVALRLRMRDDPKWHSDQDAQTRYMQLVDAEEKLAKR